MVGSSRYIVLGMMLFGLCLLSFGLLPHHVFSVAHNVDHWPNEQATAAIKQYSKANPNKPSQNHNGNSVSWDKRVLTLSDGVRCFIGESPHIQPSLLWFTLTKDKISWGKKTKEYAARDIGSFLGLLVSTRLDLATVSLGLLTSSEAEYRMYQTATRGLGLGRVTVLLHHGHLQDTASILRDNRHDSSVQATRRSEIAKLRNYLMLKTLRAEPHIIWLDADVFEIDSDIVQTMISHAENRTDVGLLMARYTYGPNRNYDKNSWAGTRPPPPELELELELADQVLAAAEHDGPRRVLVDEPVRDTTDDDLIPLTAIGGTLLYIMSENVLQGLSFPHQYTVGTRWNRDGYDGLESEGLCYRAKGLNGGRCFLLGGNWHVRHKIN